MTRQDTRRRGAGGDEIRRHNLSMVLDRIHLGGAASRSELAELTGLNRSTIRDLVAELTQLGVVVEDSGTASGVPGRPSTVVRAVPTGAVALAIELEVDFTAVAAIGIGGQLLHKVVEPNASPSAEPDAVLDRVAQLAGPVLSQLPRTSRSIGIGVAAAGLVHRRDGTISTSPNRGWSGVPLGSMLAERFQSHRVVVANEADTAALGEFRRGSARGTENLIYVSGAVGVGLGIIQGGRPMSGTSGFAGEAGHTMIHPGGRACRCGSVGCWETEVGEEALARHAGIEFDHRKGVVDEVQRRAHGGDPEALAALREVGTWLGLGVANLVNIFNPELIVFGGFYTPIYPFLEPWIVDTAARTALAASWQQARVVRSELGSDARLIGAAELVFAEALVDPAGIAADGAVAASR